MATTPNYIPDAASNFLQPRGDGEPVVEVRTPTGESTQTGEVGRSGTYIFNGIITQEEYNADLYRDQALRIWDQMRRSDGTVSAVLLACKLPIYAASWSIEPASDKPNDVKAANFLSRELFGRNVEFSSFQREAFTMFEMGYSVFEKVLEMTTFEGGTYIGLAGIASRKQRSVFYWETEEHTPGITQIVLSGRYSIPREKLVIFTHQKEGDNYEGISMLRPAYKHWQIKDKLYLIDAIKHERQGLGVVGIKTPSNAHQSDIDNAISAARNVRANEEAYIKAPDGFEIEFMDMKAHTTTDVMASVLHHDRQISKSILAQFLELGASGGSGSKALSADHSRMFMLAEEASAKTFASTIQKDVIQPLIDMNFSGLTDYPKIVHSRIGDEDISELSDAINKMGSINFLTPDAELEEAIRTTLHLPGLPDDIKANYINRPKQAAPTPASPSTSNPADGGTVESPLTASEAMNQAIKARADIMRTLDVEYAKDK